MLNFISQNILNLKNLTDRTYLYESSEAKLNYWIYLVITLVIMIIISFYLNWKISKTKQPKFYKSYLKRFYDSLLYFPLIFIILIFSRIGGIYPINIRILVVANAFIWLIWLAFLVYYRIVNIPSLWQKYYHHKREEEYKSHGKSRK